MQLEDADISEFADLWKQEFKEILSPDEARHHASQLLELYALLAKAPRDPQNKAPEAEARVPSP